MTSAVEAKLKDLGISLPTPAAPAANYVPFVLAGTMLYIAGQVPFGPDGKISHIGKLGQDVSIEEGQLAAQLCAINILAQAKAALGDLDRVKRCVKLGGFVNCTPAFADHPKVVNGASDLMVAVLGDAGRHARFAVGAPSLPFNCAVEVDAVFEVA